MGGCAVPITRVDPFSLSDAEVDDELSRPGVKRVLAEGDSWLSIFLPRNGNLLTWLESEHDVVVLDLSHPGDTLAEMAGGRQFELFQRLIGDERYGWRFDAILLNGGGNDLIGTGLKRILRKPARRRRTTRAEDCIDSARLDRLLHKIETCYRKFIDARRASALNSACPMLTWSYDFITPRQCGAQLLGLTVAGPWICPQLSAAGFGTSAQQKSITDYLLVTFKRRVLEPLALDETLNVHLVDTQGTLAPASAEDLISTGDWADEIHPSAQGWSKLGRRIGSALDAVLE
jgi:hypothetical protein